MQPLALWVVLRTIGDESRSPPRRTPTEGEPWPESIGDIVEAVPMQADVQARLMTFYEAFPWNWLLQEAARPRRSRGAARPRPGLQGEEDES